MNSRPHLRVHRCACRRLRRTLSGRSRRLASLAVLASLTVLIAVAPHRASAAVAQSPSLTAAHGSPDCDAGKKADVNCQDQTQRQQQQQTVTVVITNVINLPPAAPTPSPTVRPCCVVVPVTPCCVQPTPPATSTPVPCVCVTPTPMSTATPVCCQQQQQCCIPVVTPCCLQPQPCLPCMPPTIIVIPPGVCVICTP